MYKDEEIIDMNIFASVKAAVTVRQASEYYGLEINRNGMCCCPFHIDRHPSMKMNWEYFYCFGCGATGDVINFVARLFDWSGYEAAQKLALDFGIDSDRFLAAMNCPNQNVHYSKDIAGESAPQAAFEAKEEHTSGAT